MTRQNNTKNNEKKPALKLADKVQRLHNEEDLDEYGNLVLDIGRVIDERNDNSQGLTFLGILGALEIVKQDIIREMYDD